METFKIKGILKEKGDLRTGQTSRGEWKRQQFIVEVQSGEYVDPVAFDAWGSAVDALEDILPGNAVEVTFTLRSRQWNDRWFTDVNAIGIEEQDRPF